MPPLDITGTLIFQLVSMYQKQDGEKAKHNISVWHYDERYQRTKVPPEKCRFNLVTTHEGGQRSLAAEILGNLERQTLQTKRFVASCIILPIGRFRGHDRSAALKSI